MPNCARNARTFSIAITLPLFRLIALYSTPLTAIRQGLFILHSFPPDISSHCLLPFSAGYYTIK
ncbi:MAG: hypothetical protein II621_00390, partial [Clostridia bacterium]|nr:hypothetical protein [Clostridia bacterium]